MRGGGLGSSTISKNLMSPTPRRKGYLTTGRKAHQMVLDPIPQSLTVHFFSTPAPHLSSDGCNLHRGTSCGGYTRSVAHTSTTSVLFTIFTIYNHYKIFVIWRTEGHPAADTHVPWRTQVCLPHQALVRRNANTAILKCEVTFMDMS